MIPATQIRRGMTILFDDKVCRVLDVHHVQTGKYRGFVQAKLRDMKTGNSFEHRFSADEKVERTILEQHEME